MSKFTWATCLLLFAQITFAQEAPKKCKPFILTASIMQLGSQTIIFGCEDENTSFRGLEITLNKKNESGQVINTVSVSIDSRLDAATRSEIENSINKISDGEQSKEQARAMRQLVFKEMRLALDAVTEAEFTLYLNAADQNLKAVLLL